MLAAGELVVGAGEYAAVVEQRIETLVDDVVNQGTFPGPGGPRDADKLLQRNVDADVLEIVLASAADDNGSAAGRPALAGDANGLLAAEIPAGERFAVLQDLFQGPFGDDLAAMHAGTGAEFDDVIRCP